IPGPRVRAYLDYLAFLQSARRGDWRCVPAVTPPSSQRPLGAGLHGNGLYTTATELLCFCSQVMANPRTHYHSFSKSRTHTQSSGGTKEAKNVEKRKLSQKRRTLVTQNIPSRLVSSQSEECGSQKPGPPGFGRGGKRIRVPPPKKT
ncbi:hypothetical protein A6R68_10571, partial [Neotoma lepida]